MGTNGSSIWTDSPAGKQIQQRLSEEETLHSIHRLLDRIDTLEKAVEKLTILMSQGPGLLSMAADTIDESYRQAAQNGIDLEQRMGVALQMAEKLTAPEMLEKLDGLLNLANLGPGLIAMLIDSVDEEMRKAHSSGMDVNQLKEYGKLIGIALSSAKAMPESKVSGIFGLLRALKDPDRQRAMGFFMNFTKAFGSNIK